MLNNFKEKWLDFFKGKIRPGKTIWVDDSYWSGYIGPAKIKYYHRFRCVIGVSIPLGIDVGWGKNIMDIEVWDTEIKFIE